MIDTLPNGKFRVRAWNKGRKEPVGIYLTKEQAESAEADAYRQLEDAGGVTFGSFGKNWLDRRELDGVRDVRTERSYWRTHVEGDDLSGMALETIAIADVEDWIRRLRKKKTSTPRRAPEPIKAKTLREIVRIVRQCFDAAIPKYITINPATKPAADLRAVLRRKGDVEATEEPWTYLDPKEQEKLLTSELIPEEHRLMMAFAIYTGMRQGEQFALQLRDLHVDGDSPNVFVRWGHHGEPPKNGRTRYVYLTAEAVKVAKRWLDMLPSYAKQNPHKLVFPSTTGGKIARGKTPLMRSVRDPGAKRNQVGKVNFFFVYLADLGLVAAKRASGKDVRWHDLRHTCASSLVSGWWGRRWTLEEVMVHMGHSSIASTQRYAHLGEQAIKAAVAETPGRGQKRLPTRSSKQPSNSSASTGNHSVGRPGLEPGANGLKAHSVPEQLRALMLSIGQFHGQLSTRTEAAIATLEAGDPFAGPMIARLVEEALKRP